MSFQQRIGMLGGGQLGRMSILAGRRLGLRFAVFDAKPGGAAAMVADREVAAPWEDLAALREFAAQVDAITLEFENVPVPSAEAVAALRPLRPGPLVLGTCQHRLREKTFLRDHGFPCARFAVARSPAELTEAVRQIGTPCVVKTAAWGYDGKGQVKIEAGAEPEGAAIWQKLGASAGAVVVEEWIHHSAELSVICARGVDGAVACFPMAENVHRRHILHLSSVPARVPAAIEAEGRRLAVALAERLQVVGLLAVELFHEPTRGLLVNELAPRPHNSGHWSLDNAVTSQFEQHIRAVAGLPLGDPGLTRPAVMVNLLGDLWAAGEPDFAGLLADPTLKLHLYDKGAPAPGRKMGHFTVLDEDLEAARARAEAHHDRLREAAGGAG